MITLKKRKITKQVILINIISFLKVKFKNIYPKTHSRVNFFNKKIFTKFTIILDLKNHSKNILLLLPFAITQNSLIFFKLSIYVELNVSNIN